MNKNTTAVIFGLIVILVVGGIVFAVRQTSVESRALEPFAQCINDSGAKFYGAFWCPHCNQQKSLFGRAYKALPYIECSTPDSNGQTDICIEEEIESYPTWKFADGTSASGVVSLAVLAERTGCELPGEGEELEESTDAVEETTSASVAEVEATPVITSEEIEIDLTQDSKIEAFTPELE
jgi:hypothetical protein